MKYRTSGFAAASDVCDRPRATSSLVTQLGIGFKPEFVDAVGLSTVTVSSRRRADRRSFRSRLSAALLPRAGALGPPPAGCRLS